MGSAIAGLSEAGVVGWQEASVLWAWGSQEEVMLI
jgi:hypothetical protein